MSSLEIRVGDVTVLNRQLARMAMSVRDMRPALQEVAHVLADANKQNFDTQGAAFGRRWAPLSPAYRVWKEKHFPGRPILVRTGALRKALTVYPLDIQRTTNRSLVMGTGINYAGFHQSGGSHLPARPPIQLTEAMRREMMKVIQRFVSQGRAR